MMSSGDFYRIHELLVTSWAYTSYLPLKWVGKSVQSRFSNLQSDLYVRFVSLNVQWGVAMRTVCIIKAAEWIFRYFIITPLKKNSWSAWSCLYKHNVSQDTLTGFCIPARRSYWPVCPRGKKRRVHFRCVLPVFLSARAAGVRHR